MPAPIYCFDGWRLDTGRRSLFNPDGVEVRMTSQELDVLIEFCKKPQQILMRSQLAKRTNSRIVNSDRSIDVKIARLRRKLQERSGYPSTIKTIRHEGYWFTPDVTVEEPAGPPHAAKDPRAGSP